MVGYWATRLRGFLRHMSQHMEDVSFVDKGQYYEVAGLRSKLASKLIRSHLLDPAGLFQILKVSGKDCDCYGSFNRFLQTDKPYFIYLENPTALYHYTLGRIRFPAGRKRFAKCLNDPNLKYIICMALRRWWRTAATGICWSRNSGSSQRISSPTPNAGSIGKSCITQGKGSCLCHPD